VARFELHHNHYYTVPYSDLIHLRNHYFNDELYGDENSPFSPIAELMHAQNQGIIEGIKSSALIRGLLIAAGVMKEEDITKARERFIEENLDAKNNGGVMIIDGKFDYKNIESKPYIIDADTRNQTRQSTFDYFGVNEDFVQNKFTAEKYESIYEGKLEPFAIMFTDALTAFLFTERELGFGNEVHANMNKVKYQSTSAVVSIVNATRELGLFTRDEYREMLGYEPLGPERGGDEIMIATNNYESNTQVQEGEGSNEE
jgi:HK97 family phage portal protein